MKCSICHKEMEQGFVQFNRGLAWVKNKHKVSLSPKKDELFIYNMNTLKYIELPGYVVNIVKK